MNQPYGQSLVPAQHRGRLIAVVKAIQRGNCGGCRFEHECDLLKLVLDGQHAPLVDLVDDGARIHCQRRQIRSAAGAVALVGAEQQTLFELPAEVGWGG